MTWIQIGSPGQHKAHGVSTVDCFFFTALSRTHENCDTGAELKGAAPHRHKSEPVSGPFHILFSCCSCDWCVQSEFLIIWYPDNSCLSKCHMNDWYVSGCFRPYQTEALLEAEHGLFIICCGLFRENCFTFSLLIITNSLAKLVQNDTRSGHSGSHFLMCAWLPAAFWETWALC